MVTTAYVELCENIWLFTGEDLAVSVRTFGYFLEMIWLQV